MKENFDEIQDVLAAFQKGKKDCVDGSHGTIEEQDGVDVLLSGNKQGIGSRRKSCREG